jgi:hypothetical protein
MNYKVKQAPKDNFLTTVARLRKKASANPPALSDITKEVEVARAKRHGKKKRSDHH